VGSSGGLRSEKTHVERGQTHSEKLFSRDLVGKNETKVNKRGGEGLTIGIVFPFGIEPRLS